MKTKSGFVAVVGPPNAGKSTLINAILGAKVSIVSRRPQTTRNRILGIKNTPDAQIVLVDTPGFILSRTPGELNRILRQTVLETMGTVDLVMLVVDVNQLLDSEGESSKLAQICAEHNVTRPDVIVVNKVDTVSKPKLLPLIEQLGSVWTGQSAPRAVYPVSARTKDGVEGLTQLITEFLPAGERLFPEDVISDASESFFASEVIREKLFETLAQELPYSVAVVIEDWDEREELIRISAQIVVERESQKAIVIGSKGATLKQVGTKARIELEEIFGTKVFLKLFVKVDKNWSTSVSGLERVGYSTSEK